MKLTETFQVLDLEIAVSLPIGPDGSRSLPIGPVFSRSIWSCRELSGLGVVEHLELSGAIGTCRGTRRTTGSTKWLRPAFALTFGAARGWWVDCADWSGLVGFGRVWSGLVRFAVGILFFAEIG